MTPVEQNYYYTLNPTAFHAHNEQTLIANDNLGSLQTAKEFEIRIMARHYNRQNHFKLTANKVTDWQNPYF